MGRRWRKFKSGFGSLLKDVGPSLLRIGSFAGQKYVEHKIEEKFEERREGDRRVQPHNPDVFSGRRRKDRRRGDRRGR